MRLPCLLLLCLATPAFAEQPSAQRQQELGNLLKHDCGSCHGLPPKGGLGPSLLPEALADKSDEFLLHTIQQGRPGTAMPPWQKFLTVDESLWLIKQLRQGIQ